jgi:hypothetical protein
MADKIDSNVTGLRFAEEASLKTLPGSPVWYPLEPNSYSDFGGQIATVARNPINPSRQRKKGVTTDLDASGGFNQDLTFNNTTRLLQGFFFADMREKFTTQKLNATAVAMGMIEASADDYTAAAGLEGAISGDLILAEGFGVAANNGLKTANGTSTATALSVSDALSDENTPPSAAKLTLVGHQFASGDLSVVMNGTLVQLTSAAVTMTTLPLVAGEWIFVGGDHADTQFADNAPGFARIKRIAAGFIELDKTTWTPAADTGTGKTIRIWYGSVLKNEDNPTLIKRRTYQVERTLGNDGDGTMSEYLVGAVPNELTLNIAQADKITVDLSFVATDNEQRNGSDGVKAGTRPALVAQDAYNTSSDFARIKLARVSDDTDITPLFAFATEVSITVNNNVTPNKAVGVLGAFDTSAGTFEVGGSLEAYFASVEAVKAVRDNADITLDIILSKANKGLIFDIPLLSLGDGRLSIEQDQAIKLPLENNAAESVFGHTLLFQSFPYLPNVAG